MDQNSQSPYVDHSELGFYKLQSPKMKTKVVIYTGLANVPLFIASIIILLQSGLDCDTPVRNWLYVLAIIYFVTITASVLEIIGKYVTNAGCYGLLALGILGIFQFVWFIAGGIWCFLQTTATWYGTTATCSA